MYPRNFEYFRPSSLRDAIELIAKYNESARPLAGGMSLIPLMKLRLASPEYVIDISGLKELLNIETVSGHASVGAAVTYSTLLQTEWFCQRFPMLQETLEHIGDMQVQNRGTIAGNLAEADPSGDLTPALIALGGEVLCAGPDGQRTMRLDELDQAPFTTALRPNEIITEVRIPLPKPKSGGALLKLERRTGDYSIATAAVQVSLDAAGTCLEAVIGLGAVGPIPFRPTKAERELTGKTIDEYSLAAAAEAIQNEVDGMDVLSDIKATAEYRRDVIPTLFKRAARRAVQRAKSERSD